MSKHTPEPWNYNLDEAPHDRAILVAYRYEGGSGVAASLAGWCDVNRRFEWLDGDEAIDAGGCTPFAWARVDLPEVAE